MSPGALDRTAATRASALLIGRSSTLVTTTSLGTPAFAAAPPCTTSTTLAPGVPLSLVTCTPSEACDALPVLINSSAMRLAWSTGIAKPSPIEPLWASGESAPRVAIAELTPTSWPLMLTSAPPELPGLIAASVWIASSTVFWLPDSPVVDTGRFSALMIPVVTVPDKPSGEPIATTGWPTRRSDEEPTAMGVSPETPCTRITAISLVGSAPTTVNGAVRPSEKVTVVFGVGNPGHPARRATRAGAPGVGPLGRPAALGAAAARRRGCWSESARRHDRMMPEPSSDARPISVSNMTTLGTTLAATCSTLPGGMFAAGTLGAAPGKSAAAAGARGVRTQLDDRCRGATDTGRHHRDRQRTDRQQACAGTLLAGPAPGQHRRQHAGHRTRAGAPWYRTCPVPPGIGPGPAPPGIGPARCRRTARRADGIAVVGCDGCACCAGR